jgi:tyrosyl-tRNA synthetase
VNKLTKCGIKFVFWVADWFALMNNKMGGDIKKIQTVGRYMIEVWKACGMHMENVEFLWSSEEINKHSNDYWMRVIDIASRNNLTRIVRCSQIMGRKDDNLMASQIMYPCMQCADVFFLKADICQLGMDQRKVNVLAREYCDQIGRKLKPIILSHHMLPGLLVRPSLHLPCLRGGLAEGSGEGLQVGSQLRHLHGGHRSRGAGCI